MSEQAPPPAAPPGPNGVDLKANVDRFSDLLAKSMDLAEVGMNLSLGILSTLGAAAQQKIAQKFAEGGASTGPRPEPPHEAAPPVAEHGITNRLSLVPGGAVSISFSVNNEAASGAKQVTLHVEGFSGSRTGRSLPADMLAVSPASASIAPMDFEKFVLTGTMPADAAPDVYRGHVAVESDSVIRIPVWLTVDAPG